MDDFLRLVFQRQIIGPNDMHDSRALAMYPAKLLFESLVSIFLPTSNIQFEPGIWRALLMSFPDSGESNFYKQFRVCLGLQDTEKRWALKRRVRGLNINKFSCPKRELLFKLFQGALPTGRGRWLATNLVQLAAHKASIFFWCSPSLTSLVSIWYLSKWWYL